MKLIEHPNVLHLYDVYENKKYLLVFQNILSTYHKELTYLFLDSDTSKKAFLLKDVSGHMIYIM